MDIASMQQSVREYFDMSFSFPHGNRSDVDVLYQLFENDISKISVVLNDLIWRHETTESKRKRIDLFLLAMRAFYIQDFDIHDEYLFMHCTNPIVLLQFTKWKWFIGHRSQEHILSKYLNKMGVIHTIFVQDCEFNRMTETELLQLWNDEQEYLKSQAYFSKSLNFMAWLEVMNRYESLKHIAVYPYLFANIKYQWTPMYASLLCFQSECLEAFCTLYEKGIRHIFSLSEEIDPYDGSIPNLIIKQNNSKLLKWYLNHRIISDPYFQQNKDHLYHQYLQIAIDMDSKEIERLLKQELARRQLETYKEQLIQLTWHPDRVQWWMPHDEYQELFLNSHSDYLV